MKHFLFEGICKIKSARDLTRIMFIDKIPIITQEKRET